MVWTFPSGLLRVVRIKGGSMINNGDPGGNQAARRAGVIAERQRESGSAAIAMTSNWLTQKTRSHQNAESMKP